MAEFKAPGGDSEDGDKWKVWEAVGNLLKDWRPEEEMIF